MAMAVGNMLDGKVIRHFPQKMILKQEIGPTLQKNEQQ
jgi:hypothetical protein